MNEMLPQVDGCKIRAVALRNSLSTHQFSRCQAYSAVYACTQKHFAATWKLLYTRSTNPTAAIALDNLTANLELRIKKTSYSDVTLITAKNLSFQLKATELLLRKYERFKNLKRHLNILGKTINELHT